MPRNGRRYCAPSTAISRLVTPPRLDRRRAVIVIGCLISGVSMWALILLSG